MPDTIIVALIGAVASFLAAYLSNRKAAAVWEYRLTQIEKKQDKHNNLIERTYHLEERTAILEEKVSVANHRIQDLETTERSEG